MMSKIDPTQIAISKSLKTDVLADVKSLCCFLEKIGINAFFYSRFEGKHRVNLLSNCNPWLEHLQKHILDYQFRFEDKFHFRPGFSIDLLSYFDKNKMSLDMADYDMRNAIYLTNVSQDRKYTEVYTFTTAENHESSNQKLWLNIDKLNQFCFEFKEKANAIVKKTRLTKEDLSQCINTDYINSIQSNNDASPEIERYYLGSPYDDVYLTKKEFIYIKLYLRGEPVKKIAATYSISPRTIEKVIEIVKHKLNCRDRSALLERIIHSQLFYPLFCK